MAKTVENDADVGAFLGSVADDTRRADAESLCELMAEETGERPRMWGTGIVGFGRYPMRYADGRTAEWLAVGFAPRKANLVLYLAEGFDGHEEALAALGPHKTGRACLYLTRLDRVDEGVLRGLVRDAYAAKRAG
ncbi:MAG TPA: DUF1801 domain-containing protein [Solirubrobacteraceae bacterium]|nr:DUF1801 domain-containing protein [Solirubrobacteraceae bacterium]